MAFLISVFFPLLVVSFCSINAHVDARPEDEFYTYYSPLWGQNHISVNPLKTEVQLLIDKSSGAGFKSNADYGSGLFHIRMKLSKIKTGGIVPNFYLTSHPINQPAGNHFELDWEFIGTDGTLQTNIFDNDGGNREQRYKLWFDPSEEFHSYEILWNPYQIVFRVDSVPIREFKNNKIHGIAYPTNPMHIEASVWYGDWAGPIDWSKGPFLIHFTDFHFWACKSPNNNNCGSSVYFWNRGPSFQYLTLSERSMMAEYRKKYMIYDYCQDRNRWKTECNYNN